MSDAAVTDRPDTRSKPGRKAREVAYESAGPKALAMTPAKASVREVTQGNDWLILRGHLETRLAMLRSWRQSWASHWSILETYILPRRGIFINNAMPTPNSMVRGSPINDAIVDPTGTLAMRKCAAGMMSGLMSPSRPWFKLKPGLLDRSDMDDDAVDWFEECENRVYEVMGRSNFYDAGAQMFEDLVTFGTGPVILYEDDEDVIRAYTPCCGEYFLASSSANRVESLYRQFVMTVSAIVEMFGIENCPSDIQKLWMEKGGSLEVERTVAHAIEPNFPIKTPNGSGNVGVVDGDFVWREVYWVWGAGGAYPLSMRGFLDQPHYAPRWATTSNDAYGRSVGMDVLPDIMQLQVETMRKAEAIEKMVRPPMLASMDLKNEPSSILPGKVTYVNQLDNGKGMRPIYTVQPNIDHMMQDLAAIQQRIKEGFFNDLFMMLETASNKNMTAYEVAQRQQEKLQVLGPVIERLQNEALAPAVKRVFAIMQRKGLLPPLPKSLQGVNIGIEFVGMLALAQKASSTSALERFAGTAGNMQAGDPSIADIWDRDAWMREYADDLFIPKHILNSPEKVAALRQQRAAQMQAQQQGQASLAAVQGAKTLSDIDVGGGQNAVQAMLHGIGNGGSQ